MRVLVVDDEKQYTDALSEHLVSAGHTVTTANSFDTAQTAMTKDVDLLITDYGLSKKAGKTGADLAHWVRAEGKSEVPIFVHSSVPGDLLREKFPAGAAFFDKADYTAIMAAVHTVQRGEALEIQEPHAREAGRGLGTGLLETAIRELHSGRAKIQEKVVR